MTQPVTSGAPRAPDLLEAWLRRLVDEALADPRPATPLREVFARLRAGQATT